MLEMDNALIDWVAYLKVVELRKVACVDAMFLYIFTMNEIELTIYTHIQCTYQAFQCKVVNLRVSFVVH